MAFLCAFVARAPAQAVQHRSPQKFLPEFDSFQGGNLAYFALLPAQLAILAWMIAAAVPAANGYFLRGKRSRSLLVASGLLYLALSLIRIGTGAGMDRSAAVVFTAGVPATFHVVLAVFVVTLAHYYCRQHRLNGAATS